MSLAKDSERDSLAKILRALESEDREKAIQILKDRQKTVERLEYEPITVVQGGNVLSQVTNSVLQGTGTFAVSAIASGAGAISVYPIDLVKTRMQNQVNAG